jgi:hypothetical protein
MKQDIGYNYIARGVRDAAAKRVAEAKRRRKPLRKVVAGITLQKTIGRNHYRWVAKLAGIVVIFTPTLGRYNGKVNGWKWGTRDAVQYRKDDRGMPRYIGGSCTRLTDAVIEAQHQAVKARRFEKGLE